MKHYSNFSKENFLSGFESFSKMDGQQLLVTVTTSEPGTARWNFSSHVNLEDLKMDGNLVWLLCSLFSAMVWVIYITYYSSRVTGHLLTRLLNRFFISEGYLHVGELSQCFSYAFKSYLPASLRAVKKRWHNAPYNLNTHYQSRQYVLLMVSSICMPMLDLNAWKPI